MGKAGLLFLSCSILQNENGSSTYGKSHQEVLLFAETYPQALSLKALFQSKQKHSTSSLKTGKQRFCQRLFCDEIYTNVMLTFWISALKIDFKSTIFFVFSEPFKLCITQRRDTFKLLKIPPK